MQLSRLALLLILVILGVARQSSAQTLTKQFTYQGYLENNGVPYTGTADVNFGLYPQLSGGSLRDQVTVSNVQVTKGVFSALVNFGETDLFGAQIYDGRELYLQVAVIVGAAPPVTLTPRQLIQPAPIALSMPNITPKGTNVGIGIADPTVKLHVKDTSTNLFYMEGSNAFGSYMNLANTSAGGNNWSLISTGASNGEGAGKLLFANSSVRMTLTPTGNLGIGTTSPSARLSVDGTTNLAGATTVVGTIRHASDASANPARTFDITSGGAIDLISNADVYMNARGGRKHLLFNTDTGAGNVGIGTSDPTEKLHVNGNIRAKVIIIEGGADLAESYDVAAAGDVKPMPGMVVSIDPDRVGKLRIATSSYDRTVAGIISGADGVAPGLVLGQKGTIADGTHPIANVGRVWCYVDADAGGPVLPGDMLTTSNTPGHAMKASDAARAGGATMGKAMSRLESGKGLVLVLVTLQ